MKKIITVNGMMCEHCAASVKAALENIGAADVKIDLAAKTAEFDFLQPVEDDKILNAIEEIGLKAKF